jgi:hypothetical protein
MEITEVRIFQKHKGHLIYATAAPAAEGNKRWYAEGIVFSKGFPKRVEEIHRVKSKLAFCTEKQARDHAIALCKIWIDRPAIQAPNERAVKSCQMTN